MQVAHLTWSEQKKSNGTQEIQFLSNPRCKIGTQEIQFLSDPRCDILSPGKSCVELYVSLKCEERPKTSSQASKLR